MRYGLIFGAGEYDNRALPVFENNFVIAADGGYKHCIECGYVPDMTIGDFDSLGEVPVTDNTVTLPVEKDVTDTDAAVSVALEHGCTELHIFGGMGGRPDHTFANYSLLARLAQKGIRAFLYGEGYTVTAVTDGCIELTGKKGETVSVFSWTDTSHGVTLHGLKYPLEEYCLTSDFAIGVSNSFAGEKAYVTVKKGTLIIMKEEPV